MTDWKEHARDVYGDAWQSRMACHLGYSVSTIGRWARGEFPVPRAIVKLLGCYMLLSWGYDPDTNQVGEESCKTTS